MGYKQRRNRCTVCREVDVWLRADCGLKIRDTVMLQDAALLSLPGASDPWCSVCYCLGCQVIPSGWVWSWNVMDIGVNITWHGIWRQKIEGADWDGVVTRRVQVAWEHKHWFLAFNDILQPSRHRHPIFPIIDLLVSLTWRPILPCLSFSRPNPSILQMTGFQRPFDVVHPLRCHQPLFPNLHIRALLASHPHLARALETMVHCKAH